MFLKASADLTPSKRTAHLPIGDPKREPRKQSKSSEVRMISEFYRMNDEADELHSTYVAVVQDDKYGWETWLRSCDSAGRLKGNKIRNMIMDADINAEKRAFLRLLKPLLYFIRMGESVVHM